MPVYLRTSGSQKPEAEGEKRAVETQEGVRRGGSRAEVKLGFRQEEHGFRQWIRLRTYLLEMGLGPDHLVSKRLLQIVPQKANSEVEVSPWKVF